MVVLQGLTKKQQKAARGLAVDASSLPSARAAAAAAAAAAASGSSAAAGLIECPAGLKIGLFGQHCIDELQLPESALQRLAGRRFDSGRSHIRVIWILDGAVFRLLRMWKL